MTVSNTSTKTRLSTNGVTVDFPFGFYITDQSQVKALLVDADGVTSEYLNFTIDKAPDNNGGTLTTGDVLDDVEIVIYRDTPLTQETDYVKGGRFPADSHEAALDKLTLQNQEQQEELDRAIKADIGDEYVPTYKDLIDYVDNRVALLAPVILGDGIWTAGKTFTAYNQYLIYNGEAYSPRQETALPYTTGAVPDLGFVYQIKLNSLQALSGLTEPSDLAQRHRIKTTVAEIAEGNFNVGDLLEVSDRAGELYKVQAGGLATGNGVLPAGTGKTAIPQGESAKTYLAYADDLIAKNQAAIQEVLDNLALETTATGYVTQGPRVTIVRGQQTAYSVELGDLTFPSNGTIMFEGPTRERIEYIDNINLEVAGPSAPLGVPVNEHRITAPYHPGLVLDVKTPAFYNGVKQDAHLAADAIVGAGGADTSQYRSFIFAKDGVDEFVWQALPNNRLGMRTKRPSDGVLQDRSWTMVQETGNTGFQINNVSAAYSVHAGGRARIEVGAEALNGMAAVITPELNFKNTNTGKESVLELNGPVAALKVRNVHATANGVEVFQIGNACAYFQEGTFSGVGSTQSSMRIGQTTNGRSISASGTINASGADYAEYFVKSDGCPDIAKGEVVGIDSEGKLTKAFSEAVTFRIKSTNPSVVGNDAVIKEMAGTEPEKDSDEYSRWESQYKEAIQKIDRIALCGQVPVIGSYPAGSHLIPCEGENGEIVLVAKQSPDLAEYIRSVGVVICSKPDHSIVLV